MIDVVNITIILFFVQVFVSDVVVVNVMAIKAIKSLKLWLSIITYASIFFVLVIIFWVLRSLLNITRVTSFKSHQKNCSEWLSDPTEKQIIGSGSDKQQNYNSDGHNIFRSARTSCRTYDVHPSTRPVPSRNNFSWVHRWAVTLPSGLWYPSNRIFSESWW